MGMIDHNQAQNKMQTGCFSIIYGILMVLQKLTHYGLVIPYTVKDPGPHFNIDGLVQERRNSIANTLELRHSCTNPSI